MALQVLQYSYRLYMQCYSYGNCDSNVDKQLRTVMKWLNCIPGSWYTTLKLQDLLLVDQVFHISHFEILFPPKEIKLRCSAYYYPCAKLTTVGTRVTMRSNSCSSNSLIFGVYYLINIKTLILTAMIHRLCPALIMESYSVGFVISVI